MNIRPRGLIPYAAHLTGGRCRMWGTDLGHSFVDLAISLLRKSFLIAEHLKSIELRFLLKAFVRGECSAVQLKEHVSPEETRAQTRSRRPALRLVSFLNSRAACTCVSSAVSLRPSR